MSSWESTSQTNVYEGNGFPMWSSVKISEELPQWQRWIPPILGPVLTHAETRLLQAEVHRSFITNMPKAMCQFMDIVSWISWI